MIRPIFAIALVGALLLAGCASNTDENADSTGGGADNGRVVQGTMEVTGGNETNTTAAENSTQETNSS